MGKRGSPRRDAAWNPPSTGGDVTPLFAVLVAVPLLLPVLSGYAKALFILPVVFMAIAAPRCLAAARGSAHPVLWRVYTAAAVLGAITSVLATASLLDDGLATPAFYFGSSASVCFLIGLAAAGPARPAHARPNGWWTRSCSRPWSSHSASGS